MSSSDLLNGTSSLIEYNKTDGTYYADPTNKINKVSSSGLSGGSSSSLTHDLNGNIIDDGRNVYTFDVENKLIEVKDKASGSVIANYYYDAEGRRIKSLHGSSGQSSLYIYSGDQIVEERDSSGALLQHNVFGLGIDDLLRTTKSGVEYYPLTNDQSSVLALTDVNGNVLQRYDYDSFGQFTVQNVNGVIVTDTPLINTLFQGRELDLETGLYYFRARFYSPELGRFISHDPMNYVDGMNMYQFVRGNPTTFVDPFGLEGILADETSGDVYVESSLGIVKQDKEGKNEIIDGPQDATPPPPEDQNRGDSGAPITIQEEQTGVAPKGLSTAGVTINLPTGMTSGPGAAIITDTGTMIAAGVPGATQGISLQVPAEVEDQVDNKNDDNPENKNINNSNSNEQDKLNKYKSKAKIIPKKDLDMTMEKGLPQREWPTLGDMKDLEKVDLKNPNEIASTIYNKKLQKDPFYTTKFNDGAILLEVKVNDCNLQSAGKSNKSSQGIAQYKVNGRIPSKDIRVIK